MTVPTIYEPTVLLSEHNIFYGDNVRIDSFCKLEGGQGLYIGDNVHIASFCHLNTGGGTLVLQYGVGISSGCLVCTGNPDLYQRECTPQGNSIPIRRGVIIGKNAYLGAKVVVLPNVNIGEGAIISAGEVVRCDIPEHVIWQDGKVKCERKYV